MNFIRMPEQTWKYGYVGVAVISVLIVAVSIWIFKRKKWLQLDVEGETTTVRTKTKHHQYLMKMVCMLSLLLTLLLMLPFQSLALETPVMTVKMPKTVEAGQQFAASIQIKNNPGWSAMTLVLSFDPQQLERIDMDRGNAMNDQNIMLSINTKPAGTLTITSLYNDSSVSLEDSKDITADGTWFTLYFLVKDTLPEGTSIQLNAKLTEMVTLKLESQPLADPVSASAAVGTMAAEDRKTLPHKTKSSTTSGSGTATAASGASQNGESTGTLTNAGDSTGAASANGSSTAPNVDDSSTSGGLGWWWLVIGLAVVGVGAAAVAIFLARRSSGPKKS